MFLIMVGFMPCITLRAEGVSLTLDEAVAIALRDNRDILLKTEDVKKAKEKIAEAEAGFLPTLNFTGTWSDTKGYYSKDLAQTSTQTTFKEYLYKGGKTINTIEQKKYDLEVAGALLDKTKLETVLNVKKAFYTLLLAQEFCDLNKSIVENIQEHLGSIKERYKNGQASESDLLSMQSSLNNVQQVYEASLNQAESSQTLLKIFLFIDEDIKITPDAEFSYEPREIAFEEAFLKAMSTRPEIKQYQAQEEADKKAIEIAKSDNRPSIYASWDYYSRSHLAATTAKNWSDYNVIGITFSWPVFDGWATRAEVEQAIIDLKETQLTKEKTIRDVSQEFKNAYLDFKNSTAKLQTVEADVKVYSDNLISTNKKYGQGIASSLDLKDAGLKYGISLFNKKQAIYDYIITKGSFDKATGGF